MTDRGGPVRRLFRLGLGGPGVRERVDWEIEHHLAEMRDRLVEEGWGPEEAAEEAERRFGRTVQYRRRMERIERRRRRMTRWTTVGVAVWGAVVASLRNLARNPGLALLVALTLGLGIGANAAMFTILDRLLFSPPAHVQEHASVHRLMRERSFLGELSRAPLGTYPDVRDQAANSGVAAVAAYDAFRVTLGRGRNAEEIRAILAESALFPLLGVTAQRGRFFGPEDDRAGAEPVAVVSHEFWSSALAEDPDVLGSTLELDGIRFTVVGVAPAGFTGVELAPVDVWLPLQLGGALVWGSDSWRESRGFHWLQGVVRLREGVTVEAAEAEATAMHRAAMQEDIDAGRYDPEARVALDPLIVAQGPEAGADSRVARWLGGVSLLLLVVVCANVANLLLARGTRRRREFAVHLALGVSGRRLVGRTLLETAMHGLLGSAFGLLLATWGGGVVRSLLLPGVHFPAALGARVVAFTVGLALLAGAVAGVAPALQATRLDLARDLAAGGRGSTGGSRLRGFLTVAQAALSVLLLVGAGLFVQSVGQVRSADLGLDRDQLLTASLEFDLGNPLQPGERTSLDAMERNALYLDAADRVALLPGVEAVAGTSSPFQWAYAGPLEVPGWDSLPQLPGGGPYAHFVTADYFQVAGLEVLRGRSLESGDDEGGARVAVVSETMARTLWPEEGALGGCLRVPESVDASDVSDVCSTVVGVVEDASRGQLEEEPHMAYYLPISQQAGQRINGLYIRADDPEAVAGPVAGALRELDPRVLFAQVSTLTDRLEPQTRAWTLGATLFSVFGVLALLVAGIGLYGVLAFHVAQRTRELGIRAALGALKGELLGGVVRDGLRVTALGIVVGLGLALALGRYAEPLLFRVSSRDPWTLAGVAAILLLVGLAASLVPGLRATRVDPTEALRAE